MSPGESRLHHNSLVNLVRIDVVSVVVKLADKLRGHHIFFVFVYNRKKKDHVDGWMCYLSLGLPQIDLGICCRRQGDQWLMVNTPLKTLTEKQE